MPDNKYDNEVLIVLIVCMVVLLTLAAVLLLYLYLFQRKRPLQQRQLSELQLMFREQSLKAQLEIQEHTFQAISQEIHDNVGQVLSLAKVQINIINESERMDLTILQSIRENIGTALADLRDLARSLSSEHIRSYSLEETLFREASRINKTGIIRVEVLARGCVREIEPQKKLILFRIIQEGIQNCIKHAEATRIAILFRYEVDAIYVSIQDNGKGFDVNADFRNSGGLGLKNIRTRAHLTGGTYCINSVLQEGTQIDLTIPYE